MMVALAGIAISIAGLLEEGPSLVFAVGQAVFIAGFLPLALAARGGERSEGSIPARGEFRGHSGIEGYEVGRAELSLEEAVALAHVATLLYVHESPDVGGKMTAVVIPVPGWWYAKLKVSDNGEHFAHEHVYLKGADA